MQPLRGLLVVDLTRYLPGPFASRELLRLGARVVRVVRPGGGEELGALRRGWDEHLNAGKETLACDLKADPEPVRELLADADVVVEGFRPGVASRLGVGPEHVPERAIYCSLTGFGLEGRHAARAGHDLNYLGWAGALAEIAPGMPPFPIADLGGGALPATIQVLAALLERGRTGRGARLVVSMTANAHELAAAQPLPRVLTGGLACYRIYATQDRRYVTVAALEPAFFRRLSELIGREDLAERQYADDQEALADELARIFAAKPLSAWLELFDGEDVCVGAVATLEEAAADLGHRPDGGRPSAAGRA